jgi:adenylylsulfate kinase
MIVWIIGISGAGKTTIGRELVGLLREQGRHCLFLDGDELRDVWSDITGFTLADRRRNHERITRLCTLLDQDPEIDIIVSALSIFPDLRRVHREQYDRYLEVYLDVPIEEAVRRDPKGLYQRHKAREARDVVGIDLPFPEPETADFSLAPDALAAGPRAAAGAILARMDRVRAA